MGPRGAKTQTTFRVVVADADPLAVAFYQEVLPILGHDVCVVRSGPQVIEQCRLLRPDLVIVDVRLDQMDGISAADEICRERPTAVLLVSASYEPLWVARALGNDCILACLSKPLDGGTLAAAVALAARRFEHMQSLRAEADAARQALEDRKLIERAKAAVMRFAGVDEEDAFFRLRKLASQRNKKLCEIARDVLASAEVFHSLEHCAA